MRITFLGVLLTLALSTSVAHAGADCVAAYSTVDSALVLCPAGDMSFRVQARIFPNVLAFRVFQIMLDISQCPGLRLLQTQADPLCNIVTWSGIPYAVENCSMGDATFHLQGGGAATNVAIPVHNSHDAVVLATRVTFLSPDQNGDLIVDDRDLAIATAKLGTTDPTADFDFDGRVTSADLDTVRAHLGHAAFGTGVVSTRPGSWGRIKSLFR